MVSVVEGVMVGCLAGFARCGVPATTENVSGMLQQACWMKWSVRSARSQKNDCNEVIDVVCSIGFPAELAFSSRLEMAGTPMCTRELRVSDSRMLQDASVESDFILDTS